jgi:hypothetical protein
VLRAAATAARVLLGLIRALDLNAVYGLAGLILIAAGLAPVSTTLALVGTGSLMFLDALHDRTPSAAPAAPVDPAKPPRASA